MREFGMNDFKKSLKTTSESLDQKQVAKDRLFNLLNEQFESVRNSDLDSDIYSVIKGGDGGKFLCLPLFMGER